MRNLLFKAAFCGEAFHGWQMQANAVTVQGELTNAWERLTGEHPNIIGCSRTDAGVHAREYYFSVKTDATVPVDRFPAALTSAKLPTAIALYECREVPNGFNARFDCEKKEYEYRIAVSDVQSPFDVGRAYWCRRQLDADTMNAAAKAFIGTHDFSAFCAADTEVQSKVRTIYSAEVTRKGPYVCFTVCGDGFLYNMVRIMAGTLLYVSDGKIGVDEVPAILESKDRTAAGLTMPPDGLYLNRVVMKQSALTEDETE